MAVKMCLWSFKYGLESYNLKYLKKKNLCCQLQWNDFHTSLCVYRNHVTLRHHRLLSHMAVKKQTRPRFLWAQPPSLSIAHTNYFRKTIKALKFVLVVRLNLNEPFSSTVPAPKLIHHQEQNTGWMRGLQRVGHLYKAAIWASEAATNRDTHGHQPQSAFLWHVNGKGVIHSMVAQNKLGEKLHVKDNNDEQNTIFS